MKKIHICIGSACHVNGSYRMVKALEKIIEDRDLSDEIELVGSFCMGQCKGGVSIKCDDVLYLATDENILEIFKEIMERK